MRNCPECKTQMLELKAKTPENVEYSYYKCDKCGEEIVNMNQLHQVAEKYRNLKKYNVKLTYWGKSLGMRLPKEIVKQYKLTDQKEIALIPEKKGIRIIPS